MHTSTLGALDAVRELSREEHAVIVGQDCINEMAGEIAKQNSPLIGSISPELHLYGTNLIELGISLILTYCSAS